MTSSPALSRRRQGKVKGGRSARHHEPQGAPAAWVSPERNRDGRLTRAQLEAIGRRGAEASIEHNRRRRELEAKGFIEQKLTPEEMEAELRANPEAAAAMGIELPE